MTTWFTTKVERLNDLDEELQRLADAGHVILQVVAIDGKSVIISSLTV
jgi:hypothetical protein